MNIQNELTNGEFVRKMLADNRFSLETQKIGEKPKPWEGPFEEGMCYYLYGADRHILQCFDGFLGLLYFMRGFRTAALLAEKAAHPTPKLAYQYTLINDLDETRRTWTPSPEHAKLFPGFRLIAVEIFNHGFTIGKITRPETGDTWTLRTSSFKRNGFVHLEQALNELHGLLEKLEVR